MKKPITGLFLASAIFAAFTAQAIPAKRGLSDFRQPDGSTVKVTLNGDENCHYYLSEDGLPLTTDSEGYLRYTSIAADGTLQLSDIAVTDAAHRAPAARRLASGIDPEAVIKAIRERAALSPRSTKSRETDRQRARAAAQALADATEGLPPQSGLGLFDNTFPAKGEIRGCVILVEYTDVKFTTEKPEEYFSALLNEEGFSRHGGTGSARDFFIDQSGGMFRPTFDVYGPVTLPNRRRYYGANDYYGSDQAPEEMVIHAAQALDPDVDFSIYDYNDDGRLDNVFIFYAGQGEADDGPAESVWPHQWDVTAAGKHVTVDGLLLDHYACTNEISGNTPAGIGTFVHEFSHVMGLPDLYHTNSSTATYTPGDWSTMDYGPYNNNGRTPPNYSMYERNALGWTVPVVLGDPNTIRLEELGTSNRGCLAQTNKTNEFFLFENRQKTGWDKYVPGHGMLIWHIDFQKTVWDKSEVNNTRSHQYVDIVEANESPNNSSNASMAGYTWPLITADGKNNKTEFTASSKPAFKTWQGSSVMDITGITENNGIITFDVNGGLIDISAPSDFTAHANDNNGGASATLSWKTVEIADGYILDVYSGSGDNISYLQGYKELRLGADATSAEIEGLMPETEYTASLRATCRNVASPAAETSFTTGEIDFTFLKPVILEPADISEGTFTARWQGLPGAVSYLLTVTAEVPGGYSKVDVPFGVTSSTKAVIPEGWTWTDSELNDSYLESSRYYFGDDAPSLKFQREGSMLTSPDFGKSISGLSFFMMGAGISSTTNNALRVEGSNNGGEWFEIGSYIPKTTGQTFTPDLTGMQLTALRFTYSKPATGNIALDDIRFTITETTVEPLEGYTDREVTGTSETIDGLSSEVRYFNYSVRGVNNEDKQSASSAIQRVDMNGHYSGIGNIESSDDSSLNVSIDGLSAICTATPGAAIVATDLSGRTVALATADSEGRATITLPVQGFYIISCAGKAVKTFAGR